LNGALVVDKPAGWTSHDVVNKVRRLAGTKKVGHLGTLDPNATGVLPLLLGKATRLAQYYGKSDKRYEGTVRFGYATDTWDAEGKPVTTETAVTLDCAVLEQLVTRFRGPLKQVPPPVSAKKIKGVPAYKLARRREAVELAPCDVEVYSIELTRCEGNEADLSVHCSAGTYLRSIAHELGQESGCGAFLKCLRRTASGSFQIADARSIPLLERLAADERIYDALIPMSELLPEIPAEVVDPTTAGFIRQGRDFRVSPFRAGISSAKYVKAVGPDGDLVAIGEVRLPNLYHPVLVL
jgi:tRNA pseudouridine55 synthase